MQNTRREAHGKHGQTGLILEQLNLPSSQLPPLHFLLLGVS